MRRSSGARHCQIDNETPSRGISLGRYWKRRKSHQVLIVGTVRPVLELRESGTTWFNMGATHV